jgi:hypothetical protein
MNKSKEGMQIIRRRQRILKQKNVRGKKMKQDMGRILHRMPLQSSGARLS